MIFFELPPDTNPPPPKGEVTGVPKGVLAARSNANVKIS
jgi:hypothetical protein